MLAPTNPKVHRNQHAQTNPGVEQESRRHAKGKPLFADFLRGGYFASASIACHWRPMNSVIVTGAFRVAENQVVLRDEVERRPVTVPGAPALAEDDGEDDGDYDEHDAAGGPVAVEGYLRRALIAGSRRPRSGTPVPKYPGAELPLAR